MEKRLNRKIEVYVKTFKDDIRKKAEDMSMKSNELDNLFQYIYDYNKLELTVDDFKKRKRIKNFVPVFERCCAKRANNEQCTRRKKEGDNFCGTHTKGTPHGITESNEENTITTSKIEVWAQDISGIIYYVDTNYNVYKTEDILLNKINPLVIAKYEKKNDVYSIPEYNI
jgi:hypothetical protein